MPYAKVKGTSLYYEDYGEGPAVILTPGGRVDCNGLRPMAALLSPHCRVIIHDRRNCGRSDVVIGGSFPSSTSGPRKWPGCSNRATPYQLTRPGAQPVPKHP